MMLCRGSVREKIFDPWKVLLKSKGCEFRKGRGVTDFFFSEETGCVSEVVFGNDRIKVDAVILGGGVSACQDIVRRRFVYRNLIQLNERFFSNLK